MTDKLESTISVLKTEIAKWERLYGELAKHNFDMQSEVDSLLQAANEAALRDFAEHHEIINGTGNCSCGQKLRDYETGDVEWKEHIKSLIPEPSALARHDAELVERHLDHLVSMEGWMSPERVIQHDEKLKAEFAAVMEKAATLEYQSVNNPDVKFPFPVWVRDLIRALIPTDYASALDRRLAEARLEESEWWHNNSMEPHNAHNFSECHRVAELRRAVKGESDAK